MILKKLMIIVISVLVVGCSPETDTQVKYEKLESEIVEVNDKYSDLVDVIEQLTNINDEYENEKILYTNEIVTLNERIVALEVSSMQPNEYINNLDYKNSYKEYITDLVNDIVIELDDYTNIKGIEIDVIEHIAYYNTKRLEELNFDTENQQIISGVYIYNSPDDNKIYEFNERLKIYLLDYEDMGERIKTADTELITNISESPNTTYIFHIVNNVVIRIEEYFSN
jgi:hypothetical protein